MSRLHSTRRAGLPAGFAAAASVAAVLGATAPAMADVTVSPPSARQGSGENLTFRVTNDGTRAITRVKLVLPPDTPVAEVYPLSVDDWAPQITQQELTTPLTTIHGGDPVTETAKDITWIAVGGRALAPGASADLGVAIGPMPELSSMSFTLLPTYAGGRPGPALAPVTLALTPAAPGQEGAGHDTHGTTGGAPAGEVPAGEQAWFADAVGAADDGPGFWSIAGWVVAVLALAGAAVVVLRGRRRRAAGPTADHAAQASDDAADAAGRTPRDAAHTPREGAQTSRGAAGTAGGAAGTAGGAAGTAGGAADTAGGVGGRQPVTAGVAAKASAWRYRDTGDAD